MRAVTRRLALVLLALPTAASAQGSPEPAPASEPEPQPEPQPEPEPAPPPPPSTVHRHDFPDDTIEASDPKGFGGPVAAAADLGFGFGSYGRIAAGSDLHGGRATPLNVVAHGSRVVEPTYLELDFYYRMRMRDVRVTTVTTLAFGDLLFHDTGEFDAEAAVRNLYLEVTRPFGEGVGSAWVGSRMYRGDDIYLLDYWPLDDANTLGGGLGYELGRLLAAAHVGWNRLRDPFQYQEHEVFTPDDGAVAIPELDRQRWIASAKSSYRFWGDGQGLTAKAKLYGELTGLPSGQRRRDDDTLEELPADRGFALGGQLGLWSPASTGSPAGNAGAFAPLQGHVNLFLRYGKGLSAYDELAVPGDLAADRKTYPGASELVLGTSGNLDLRFGGGQLGAYLRRFTDADPSSADRDDGWEYVVAARPRARIVDQLEGALDLSWQVRFPRGLDPVELTAMDPAIFQIAPMLVYTPLGIGGYARPQLRLVYRYAHLNEGARSELFPLDDPRRERDHHHFLGLQAEWWFNSTYR
jgi:maltoporin